MTGLAIDGARDSFLKSVLHQIKRSFVKKKAPQSRGFFSCPILKLALILRLSCYSVISAFGNDRQKNAPAKGE
jgi:hypothetical protein